MHAPLLFTFLTAALAGCGGQPATAVSFGLEPGALIAEDASFTEPPAPSSRLTSRSPSGSPAADAGSPEGGAAKVSREMCPVKCTMVVPGRAPLAPQEETEFVTKVQSTMDRLAACDASVRPAPTLTLRFAEDGSLIATGVDEDKSQGAPAQCLRDSASVKALRDVRSLPGAVVRCQEQCAGGSKATRRTKERSR